MLRVYYLGIIKFIYLSNDSSWFISSWVLTNWTQPFNDGKVESIDSVNTLNKAVLDSTASFPPFRIKEFPDFIAKENIWTAASGLASNIIHRTPYYKILYRFIQFKI